MYIGYQGPLGNYFSDLIIRKSNYSFRAYSIIIIIEKLFNFLFGDMDSIFTAIFISILETGTILGTYYLLKQLLPEEKEYILMIFAVLSMHLIPIYIPSISELLYGALFGSVWHNETYIGMRFFAILLLIFFYKTHGRYLELFSARDFIISTILFSLVNLSKPNFIIAFAPAMLIMMIYDIVKAKGKGLRNWFLFGIPVLISGIILVPQYLSLFGPTSSTSDSHVIIDLSSIFSRLNLSIIGCIAFPLYIFVTNFKTIIKNKFYSVCFGSWLFSFFQYLFLSETGTRAADGNFTWGIDFFCYLIFVLCIALLLNNLRKNTNKAGRIVLNLKSSIPIILLAFHLLFGLLYFVRVALGECAYTM